MAVIPPFALHRNIRFVIGVIVYLFVCRYAVQTAYSILFHYNASYNIN